MEDDVHEYRDDLVYNREYVLDIGRARLPIRRRDLSFESDPDKLDDGNEEFLEDERDRGEIMEFSDVHGHVKSNNVDSEDDREHRTIQRRIRKERASQLRKRDGFINDE